ncbi:winged helix-turn-helix domain-containing protein [Aurantiacibacter sp. D1-12]|uniref:winged helix-turn-helix domain-containing protein n=1 Tax=Aurantiacibacter sp. D1-12 TaxID=2993658 RepID=UPI00237CFD19|nr:helix-turn-helix domain-containing protein [Aurantiacibacter sp. D1-12]MDE1466862.1 helix-turn-helix domain-containing protein [Aurantiacibacter sp. D1-12]
MKQSASETDDQGETMWILDPVQLRCLASAARLDIVDQLAGHGTMSISELGKALGREPSSLYHHMRQLLTHGLVLEDGTRTVNRRVEKLYRTPSRRMRLRKALADPANADIMRDHVRALLRQAERDFVAGQKLPGAAVEGPDKTLGFARLVSRMDAERLERFNALLEQMAELMWEENEPDAPGITFTWVLAPTE